MRRTRERRLLHASAFVRALATSTAGITVGSFLGKLDADGAELGAVISAGLAARARGRGCRHRRAQKYILQLLQ